MILIGNWEQTNKTNWEKNWEPKQIDRTNISTKNRTWFKYWILTIRLQLKMMMMLAKKKDDDWFFFFNTEAIGFSDDDDAICY